MRKIFNIINIFLFLSYVRSVFTYHAHEESPSIGYIAVQNGVRYSKIGLNGLQKKYFAGAAKYQQYSSSDNIVDSHFKVMRKSQLASLTPLYERRYDRLNDIRNANKVSKVKDQNKIIVDESGIIKNDNRTPLNINRQVIRGYENNIPVSQVNRITVDVEAENIKRHPNVHPIRSRNQNLDTLNEHKPKPVQIKVHKSQITTDGKKFIAVNNNRKLSKHSSQETFSKITNAFAPVIDFQQPFNFAERNPQGLTGLLENVAYGTDEINHKSEYKKRDTENLITTNNEEYNKSKRNLIFETMRKYIGSDKNKRISQNELTRIGNKEESIGNGDKTYAVFYRMNPEFINRQDDFIIVSPVKKSLNKTYGNKDALIPFDNEIDYGNTRLTKTMNAMKVHKNLLKNFSTFRNM